MIKSVVGALFGALVIYLLGAFANASFDISVWSDTARGMVALYMVFGIVAGAMFAQMP